MFPVLKQIRIRAGLTQKQIAEATGAGGKHGNTLIARLEAGHIPNPSARLVLDYLRACGATVEDVREFLGGYLGARLPVPGRPGRGPRLTKPKPKDAVTLALRKEAAWWNLRRVVEQMLYRELNELRAKPMSKERKHAADFGRKVFRILYQTRQMRPALRERRLKRCRAWAERKTLPAETVDTLHASMAALFADMERHDELDWLPAAEDAKQIMLLPPRHRLETDADLCRDEQLRRETARREALEAARKPIIEAALALLKAEGLGGTALGNYRHFINAFLLAAETTTPGSTDRAKRIKNAIHSMERPYIDQALLHRLAELITSLRGGNV